jgi:hypothetical protein
MRRACFALSLAMLGGCVRTTSIAPAVRNSAGVGVGYVRIDLLLKDHPLYSALTRLDHDVAVLELQVADPATRGPDVRIAQEAQAMRRDLQSAQERTEKELLEKQSAYIQQENTAIAGILQQGGIATQSADAIERQIAQASHEQAKNLDEQAKKNFQAFRLKMIAQADAALTSVRRSLLDRADRAYRTRANEYAQNEAAFTLEQAHKNAIERLVLRIRLTDLALDKQALMQTQARLHALGKQEADELRALHERDQAALASFEKRLLDERREQESQEAQEMQARTNAKLSDSAGRTQPWMLGQLGIATAPPLRLAAPGRALSPALREKLIALHKTYQATYVEDAERTVRRFARTAKELSAHFNSLAGVDAAAQEDANKEIEGLRKQRNELYEQMVAQINREVQRLAERRGIGRIEIKVSSPGDGVDLTHDAAETIEGLHE